MTLSPGGPQPTPTCLKVWKEGPLELRHPGLRNTNQYLGLAGSRAPTSLHPKIQPASQTLKDLAFTPASPPPAHLTDLPGRGLTGVGRGETAKSPSCRHDSLELKLIHNCKYLLAWRSVLRPPSFQINKQVPSSGWLGLPQAHLVPAMVPSKRKGDEVWNCQNCIQMWSLFSLIVAG